MPEAPCWFVSDLCDTLYSVNTTFEFARYVAERRGRLWGLGERALNSRRLPAYYVLAAVWRMSGVDLARHACMQFFRGLSERELGLLAEDFVQERLELRRILPAWDEVERARADGYRLAILSASISPVVAAVARSLGAEFAASELRYDEMGHATGALASDLTGRKHEWILTRGGVEAARLVVMTDNLSDFRLMELAGRRLAVVVSEQQRRAWAPLNPEFVKGGRA